MQQELLLPKTSAELASIHLKAGNDLLDEMGNNEEISYCEDIDHPVFAKVRSELDQALFYDPRNFEALSRMAETYADQSCEGQVKNHLLMSKLAIEYYKEALLYATTLKEKTDTHYCLSMSYLDVGDLKASVSEINICIKDNPKEASFLKERDRIKSEGHQVAENKDKIGAE